MSIATRSSLESNLLALSTRLTQIQRINTEFCQRIFSSIDNENFTSIIDSQRSFNMATAATSQNPAVHSYFMDARQLTTAEIQYEWSIRGMPGIVSAIELNRVLEQERQNGIDPTSIGRVVRPPANYRTELFALYTAISQLHHRASECTWMSYTTDSSIYSDLSSRVAHYLARMNRVHESHRDSAFETATHTLEATKGMVVWLRRLSTGRHTTVATDQSFATGNLHDTLRTADRTTPPMRSNDGVGATSTMPMSDNNPFIPRSQPTVITPTHQAMTGDPGIVHGTGRSTINLVTRPNLSPIAESSPHRNMQSNAINRGHTNTQGPSNGNSNASNAHRSPAYQRTETNREPNYGFERARHFDRNETPHENAAEVPDRTSTEQLDRSGQRNVSERRTSVPRRTDEAYRSTRIEDAEHTKACSQESLSMRRYVGAKTYDGEPATAKTLALDDLIDVIQSFQESLACTDAVVLRNIGMTLSGDARIWWRANRQYFHTVEEWERAIRSRFELNQSTKEALMSTIYSRKQRSSESLSKFIDEMNVMMDRLPNEFSELHRITLIIANSSESCRQFLRLRNAQTMYELVNYAYTFVDEKTSNKPQLLNKFLKMKKINATVIQDEEESEESSAEEPDEGAEIDVQAIMQYLKEKTKDNRSKSSMANKKPAIKSSQNPPRVTHIVAIEGEEPTICPNCLNWGHRMENCSQEPKRRLCFGCGRPNTIRRNCPTCSQNPKNSEACLKATAVQTQAKSE